METRDKNKNTFNYFIKIAIDEPDDGVLRKNLAHKGMKYIYEILF